MDEKRWHIEDKGGRSESTEERSDRNWSDILQELRVTQTGTQIMSGFLLTLPFQQRFSTIRSFELVIYVALLVLAAATTAVGLAPVSLHRMLFRRHEKTEMVDVADRVLQVNLILVAALSLGVVVFVLNFTISVTAGILGGAGILILMVVVLFAIPRAARSRKPGGASDRG